MAWEFESPPLHTMSGGNSSVGRAQPCQGWGREFESRFPLAEHETSSRLKQRRVSFSARRAKRVKDVKHRISFAALFFYPCPGGGMVDARVSGARAERRAGSSPVLGTTKRS